MINFPWGDTSDEFREFKDKLIKILFGLKHKNTDLEIESNIRRVFTT